MFLVSYKVSTDFLQYCSGYGKSYCDSNFPDPYSCYHLISKQLFFCYRYRRYYSAVNATYTQLFYSYFYSHAMQLFMSSHNKLLQTTKGYYGGITFLDNQEEFNLIFGLSPVILPSDPMSTDELLTHKLQRSMGKIQTGYFM